MRRLGLAVLLLSSACAVAKLKPTAERPQWIAEELVWVDPNPGAPFGFGGSMEDGARQLQNALLEAGMQPGSPDDPKTLLVKLDGATGMVNVTFSYKLFRGGRILEEGAGIGPDEKCWSMLSTKGSKVECAMNTILDRILNSRILALEHQQQPPQAAQPQQRVAARVHLSGRLAVLDLRNLSKDLSADDARYFTDLVRGAVLKYAPDLDVMTRENLIVLLKATGKDIANCEGECEVDTGRRIGADAIISGEIQKVGTRYKISLRLHETHEGRLAGASVASGKSIDELDDSANKAVASLFDATK